MHLEFATPHYPTLPREPHTFVAVGSEQVRLLTVHCFVFMALCCCDSQCSYFLGVVVCMYEYVYFKCSLLWLHDYKLRLNAERSVVLYWEQSKLSEPDVCTSSKKRKKKMKPERQECYWMSVLYTGIPVYSNWWKALTKIWLQNTTEKTAITNFRWSWLGCLKTLIQTTGNKGRFKYALIWWWCSWLGRRVLER